MVCKRAVFVFVFVLSSVVANCSWAQATSGFIFPPQSKHAHSSSVVECPNGDLLVCWYRGSGERSANDVRIEGARSRNGGRTWSPPFLMADTPELPDCNPILFVDAQQRLWLFWAVVVANRWEHSLLKFVRADEFSSDGAPRWNWQDVIVLKPGDDLPKQIRAGFDILKFEQNMWAEYARPYDRLLEESAQDASKRQQGWLPRNHITVLPSGRLLLPLYSDGFNISLMAVSDDTGKTWQASRAIVGLGPIQPSVVRKTSGELVAYFRDAGPDPHRVLTSSSRDDGLTWTAATDTDLPNPGSSLEVIRLNDGDWLICLNDTERGRRQLAVMLSRDEGKTWSPPKYLDRDPTGWYAYPSITQARNGTIHATYSYTQAGTGETQPHRLETIKHVAFDKAWVIEGP